MVSIEGDNLFGTITDKGPVLEIKHNRYDDELYNSKTVVVLKKDKAPFNFDPYLNLNVDAILKKVRLLPRNDYRAKSTEVDYLPLDSKGGLLGSGISSLLKR